MRGITTLPGILVFILLTSSHDVLAAPQWQNFSLEVSDQELLVKRFAANGKHLVLWLTPGSPAPEREYALASELAQLGVEVWHLDLAESQFLPKSTRTLRAMDGQYVADLITAVHAHSGKQIVVLTRGYGSLPVLRGARLWQQQFFQAETAAKAAYFSGAILFSPELYSHTTELGLEPVYDPIARATNIPIMLYQDGKRGNRWQLEKTMALLSGGGAQVYLKLLPGVTGLFYDEDVAAATLSTLAALPGELVAVLRVLGKTPLPQQVVALADRAQPDKSSLDTRLMPYHGSPSPLALALETSEGKRFQRDDYRGQVTLVNFWASWCGPCVEEIPSLNSLREKMRGRPLQLISVNYAEDPQRIAEFLQRVKVDFPVLLDPDGRVSAQWKVMIFPATFVIGPDGKIVYGVNGAIYWDSAEVITKIEDLLAQVH